MDRIDDFTLETDRIQNPRGLPTLNVSKKTKLNAAMGFGDIDAALESPKYSKKRPPKAKIFQDD